MARNEAEEQAYQDGFADGFARGREEGRQQGLQEARRGQVIGATGPIVTGGSVGGETANISGGRASIGGGGDYKPPKL